MFMSCCDFATALATQLISGTPSTAVCTSFNRVSFCT